MEVAPARQTGRTMMIIAKNNMGFEEVFCTRIGL